MWGIILHKNSEIGLSRQIYLSLKEHILTGRIAQAEALPSTREFAKGLGVSRNTVCEAYDMLWTEGFIIKHQGSPSRVANGLQIQSVHKKEMEHDLDKCEPTILWDFKTGQPDLSLFPRQVWNEIISKAAWSLSVRQLGYSGPKGYEPLCEAIALWLWRSRSMKVDSKDIFITSGATQALSLLVDILNKEKHAFALENPSHPGIRTVISDKGYPLHWMPVDSHGADVSSINGRNISAVYVTPSHQFPLGGILPAARRATLIKMAIEKNFYVIEDDYDSEFRYCGSPISPIYAMDTSHIIYVGTFSKTLFPALRLGFAVLPKSLHAQWKHYRNYMDVQNPIMEQAGLAEFLQKRKMDKHVQRMRRVYGEKRDVLLKAVKIVFGDYVHPWGDVSGLHVVLQFPGHEFGKQFELDCMNAGIRVSLLAQYCLSQNDHRDKLIIGYGHLNAMQIQEGIKSLHRLIMCR